MFKAIRHTFNVGRCAFREYLKANRRSPEWRYVQKAHLTLHPTCAACGGSEHLNVHHIVPFSNAPERELDLSNLITLCMGERECHLRIGHGGHFARYNPNVVADAAEVRTYPIHREYVVRRAKKHRLD